VLGLIYIAVLKTMEPLCDFCVSLSQALAEKPQGDRECVFEEEKESSYIDTASICQLCRFVLEALLDENLAFLADRRVLVRAIVLESELNQDEYQDVGRISGLR
jgi:hypothetical protein